MFFAFMQFSEQSGNETPTVGAEGNYVHAVQRSTLYSLLLEILFFRIFFFSIPCPINSRPFHSLHERKK